MEASTRCSLSRDRLIAEAHAARIAPTAGTSDVPVAREAARTLLFEGVASETFADVGVAGLWRLLDRAEELKRFPVVIVAAGMDAALPSVVAGLLPGLIVAVPTSVGYGVAQGGHAALNAVLASCAPGIVTVNIDNGYGAACAAIRALGHRIAHQRWNHGTPKFFESLSSGNGSCGDEGFRTE